MPPAVKKYSIKEVDVLITSINSLSGETEEAICKALGYNEGYIAQLRSREKADELPQVSPKFYNILSDYRDKALQKVNKMQGDWRQGNHNGTLSGSITIHDYRSEIEKKIAEIEARRLEAVARAEEIKEMYLDTKEEKRELLRIISENLTALLANSNKHLAYLEKILLVDRVDHETTMDSLDRLEHQPVGSNSKRAGTREVAASKNLRKKDKNNLGGVNR